jgi:predicted RNase H-like nuclease
MIAGIDRYRRGWVAVVLDPLEIIVAGRLAALVERVPEAVSVGVDMPIGLPAMGEREADVSAREFVGRRWSSVFMTSPRHVLEAESYNDAKARSLALTGKMISRQAWALKETIFEVEGLDDPRVIEVHPEVSFCAMSGGHVAHAKSTWNGQALRRSILAEHGIELPEALDEAGDVPVADVLDAAAVAWSADRYARGIAGSLPAGAPRGQREVIWY